MPLNFSFLKPVHHPNAAKLKKKAKLAVGAKSISLVKFCEVGVRTGDTIIFAFLSTQTLVTSGSKAYIHDMFYLQMLIEQFNLNVWLNY